MTQRNRPAVSIDISAKETITGVSAGTGLKSTWNAAKGADEMRKLAEDIARAEHQREMDLQNNDPTIKRIIELESQVALLTQQVGKLLAKAGVQQ